MRLEDSQTRFIINIRIAIMCSIIYGYYKLRLEMEKFGKRQEKSDRLNDIQ